MSLAGCAPSDDPALARWRTRLAQEARLTDEELGELRPFIAQQVRGRTIQIVEGATTRTLDEAQRAGVFDVLTLPAGVFDEGIRREGEGAVRVLNGPARSDNVEIETTQRLLIDVRTVLPRRYEFSYAFPGYGQDQAYDLVIGER